MLFDQIAKDYVQAMKDRDNIRSSTLNFLRAQLKNVVIEKRAEKLDDPDVVTVIKKQIKQRQDSIAQYTQGGRQDLVDKEAAELAILKTYLPDQLGEDQIKKLVQEAIVETKAASIKDMGAVMKIVSAKASGRADNRLVSEIVKQTLSTL